MPNGYTRPTRTKQLGRVILRERRRADVRALFCASLRARHWHRDSSKPSILFVKTDS